MRHNGSNDLKGICMFHSSIILKMDRKLTTLYHASHRHKLFQTLCRYQHTVKCVNRDCDKILNKSQVFYWCPRCEFDLCNSCFNTPVKNGEEIPLSASDDEIDTSVDFNGTRLTSRSTTIDPRKCKPSIIEDDDYELEDN